MFTIILGYLTIEFTVFDTYTYINIDTYIYIL